MIPFGEILRKLRNDRNWSQAKLAKRLGISASIIAHYESGERFPSLENLMAVARQFGVSTDYLLGIESDRRNCLDTEGLTPEQVDSLQAVIDNYRKLNH